MTVAATAAVVGAFAVFACGTDQDEAAEVTRANPIIPLDSGIVVIRSGGDTIQLNVEIAETAEQQRAGLMERHALGDNEGMLFVYAEDQAPSDPFYTFRTRIPLDIAFFDSTGDIVAIRQMEPCTSPAPEWCESYPPGAAYRGALEVKLGLLGRHGIEIGDRVALVERFEP